MFSTFLETISGYFNKRFLLSAFFPSLAFGVLSLLAYVSLHGPTVTIEAWNAQPSEWRTFLTVIFFGALLFLAYLLETFSVSLTRLYEGYWSDIPVFRWWGQHRRGFYQRSWDYLNRQMKRLGQQIALLERKPPPDESDAEKQVHLARIDELYAELGDYEREWFLFYPHKRALVMPTRLGNILRAAELYPFYRYNLDAVVTWPRLQSLLPEEFSSGLKDAKSALDLLLNLTTLTGFSTLGWELALGLGTRRWDLFLMVSLGWLVVYLSYQAALQSARTYAELIKAAYDLHRWRLLDQLHLKQPTSWSEERELWEDVTDLLYRSFPPNRPAFRYTTAKEPPTSEKQPPSDWWSRLWHWFFGRREHG